MGEAEELVGLHIRIPKEQRELLHQARIRVKMDGKHITIQQLVKTAIDREFRRISL